MNSTHLMVAIGALLQFCTGTHGEVYYYEGTGRVDPVLSTASVTVQIDETEFSSWNALMASDSAINDSNEPVAITDSFFVLSVNEGFSADSLVDRLRTRPDIRFANPVLMDEDNREIYVSSYIGVLWNEDASRQAITSVVESFHLVLTDSLFGDFRFQILRLTELSPDDALSVGNAIFETGLATVARAALVLPFERHGAPDDEYWDYQWHFKNTGQFSGTPDADIDLELAFDYYFPPATLLVGVIDAGFEPHEDLPAERLANGWDYARNVDDESPIWYDAHGMATTGIIGATSNNAVGVASVCSDHARILHNKIFHGPIVATDAFIARAISDAVDSGVVVISNSWGTRNCNPSSFIDLALARAYAHGVVVVFSAGNAGRPWVGYPACHPLTIAVGATDSLDDRYSFSQYGADLDVVAPGANIAGTGHFWTLDEMGSDGYNDGSMDCLTQDADYICNFGGTSAACPQVAGIATLLMIRRPDLIGDPDRVRRIVRLSSEREHYGGYDTLRVNDYVGWGRVNADRALLSVTRGDVNNDGAIDIDDVNYLIAYIFTGGPSPQPHIGNGDANCQVQIDLDDVVYLIAYIFTGGPEPPDCFDFDYPDM